MRTNGLLSGLQAMAHLATKAGRRRLGDELSADRKLSCCETESW